MRKREVGKQHARFAEALQNALPPVLHTMDFLLVKERNEFALRKRSKVALDALDRLGDTAQLVVTTGVRDEEVVGHGLG